MDELGNYNREETEFDAEESEGEENNRESSSSSSDESDKSTDHDEQLPENPAQDMEEDTGNPQEEIEKTIKSKNKRVRGLTRLVKLYRDFEDSNGQKRVVGFDEWGRFTGKFRSEIASYMGDLVRREVGLRQLEWKKVTKEVKDKLWEAITRYYEIDESRRKDMMSHLGTHLRDFRRKLYAKYVKPNMGKPAKLKVIPKKYRSIVDQEQWDEFVKWTLSDEFKGKSEAAIEARAKSKYPHRLGRSGYSGLREKLVKNKELVEDELPARSFMWRKARVNKDGEYEDDDLRDVANKITDCEKEIGDGTVKVDQGTDALTLVFGKDHGGRVRGAGKGVTPTKYWHLPPRRGSSKESISQLQKQLDAERRERELKDAEVKDLHKKMQEQGEMMNAIVSQLTSQGIIIPGLTTTTNSKSERQNNLKSGLPSSQGTLTTSNHSNGSRQDHPLQKSSKTTRQSSQLISTSSQQSAGSRQGPPNFLKSPIPQQKSPPSMQEFQTATSQVVPTGGALTVKCKLSHPEVRNIVARGTIYYSSGKQIVHGVPLKGDCYKVSIDEAIKPASFLPIQAGEHKTVGEANKSFVAWPKKLVIIESKVLEPTSDQHNENLPIVDQQNEKPKHNKRKKDYTTPDGKPKHTRSSYNKMHNVLDK